MHVWHLVVKREHIKWNHAYSYKTAIEISIFKGNGK